MADEAVDIYDENMVHTGKALKSEAHRTGLWHKAIHCWVVRSQPPGYVLFQKRGSLKAVYPNHLDISAAGHYLAGESVEDGVREILEEIGLPVKFSDLVRLGIKHDVARFREHIVHEFCEVFLLKSELPPEKYTLNKDELDGLVEMSIPDGLALFSGESLSASVSGVEWDATSKQWIPVSLLATKESVIPRVDPYYLKIMIMAKALLAGERYLSI